VTQEGQPGWAGTWPWTVVFGKHSAHHILIDFDAKFCGDDVRDTRTAESRIAPFNLNDCANEFL
jgi:hypothetical protein